MIRTTLAATAIAVTVTAAGATDLKIPPTVILPQLEPIVSPCADPAADRFLEVDLMQRPPAGATRIQRLSAWTTSDGMFHWPFVMRVRNLGDQPFFGKPGEQSLEIIEEDHTTGKKRVAGITPFDRIPPHGSLPVRFLFSAPTEQVAKGKFRRTYTLQIAYKTLGEALINGRNGDCNLRNNMFSVEFNGATKTWITAKK
jgi:hypothetical protein